MKKKKDIKFIFKVIIIYFNKKPRFNYKNNYNYYK